MNRTHLISAMVAVAALAGMQSCESAHKSRPFDEMFLNDTTLCEAPGFTGTYEGTLPCADCAGKATLLVLNDDQTYDLTYEYLDKAEDAVAENGVYTVVRDSLIELTAPSSNDRTFYRVVPEGVALTDSSGVPVSGDLAAAYVLKKK